MSYNTETAVSSNTKLPFVHFRRAKSLVPPAKKLQGYMSPLSGSVVVKMLRVAKSCHFANKQLQISNRRDYR